MAEKEQQNKPINRKNGLPEAYKRMIPREVEVFELTTKGKTNKEIGKRLNISWRTVKKHRENIRTKLNLEGHHALSKWKNKMEGQV